LSLFYICFKVSDVRILFADDRCLKVVRPIKLTLFQVIL